jgi:hypothetical protein
MLLTNVEQEALRHAALRRGLTEEQARESVAALEQLLAEDDPVAVEMLELRRAAFACR